MKWHVFIARITVILLVSFPLLKIAWGGNDDISSIPPLPPIGLTSLTEPRTAGQHVSVEATPPPVTHHTVAPVPPIVISTATDAVVRVAPARDDCIEIRGSHSNQRRIQLCYNPSTCSGEVRIDTHRNAKLGRPLSKDTTWATFLLNTYGADSWRVVVEGKERYVLEPELLPGSETSYRFPFQLMHPGEYSFTVKWEYAEGWGIDETRHRPLRNFNKQLVHKGQETRKCNHAKVVPAQQALVVSRWVRRDGVKGEFGAVKAMTQGRHRILKGIDYEWLEWDSTLKTLHPPKFKYYENHLGDLLNCFKENKWEKMLITGDSQSRSIFYAVKNRLTGEDQLVGSASQDIAEGRGEKVKFAEATLESVGLQLTYVWDNYLEKLRETTHKADVIIAGYGAHPASWGQWTYQRFNESVREVSNVLCDAIVTSRGKKRVVWYGAPAWPKLKPDDNFRVTNSRLHMFNRLAEDAMKYSKCGQIPTVDFFRMSWPQIKLSKDGAHYDHSVVLSAFVDYVMSKIC